MLEVAASEFDLITVARAIVGLGDPAPSLLRGECKLSNPSPDCAQALRETLAMGCVRRLALGGWRREDRVRKGERVKGRLWERHAPPSLEFTSASEELLRWMTQHSMVLEPPKFKTKPETVGDELFYYLALASAARGQVAETVAAQPGVQGSALCWLSYPNLLAIKARKNFAVPSFERFTDGLIIEAIELELGERWFEMERDKGLIVASDRMTAIGAAQTRVLTEFFATIDKAKRRDLCRFAVLAAARLVAERPSTELWLAKLAPTTKLSARQGARTAATAFLAMLETVAGWVEQAGSAHFIDDDYAAAQILLEIWETLGPQRLGELRGLRKEMTSIEAVTGEGESS